MTTSQQADMMNAVGDIAARVIVEQEQTIEELAEACKELLSLFEAWRDGPLNGVIQWITEPMPVTSARAALRRAGRE